MQKNFSENIHISSLLNKFNNRDEDAFAKIYTSMYRELFYYSHSLYKNTTIDSADIIHDIFLHLWEDNNRKFENIKSLKTYLYISIKNKFISHLRHQNIVDNNTNAIIFDNDYFILQAAEAEIFSIVPSILGLLPQDCAETINMLLNGYEIKEIAKKLNKPATTIYSQRDRALNILREKLSKDKLLILMLLLRIS